MTSILAQCKAKNINFTASSSTPRTNNSPYFAFNTEGDYFGTEASPYYWQVSFPQNVTVSSYQLGGNTDWKYYTTKWEVSYSNDPQSFVSVQTDSRSSPGTTYTFQINPPISCKHFRITAKSVSQYTMKLIFYKFDLFGSANIVKARERNTCNIRRIKAQLIMNALIMTMQSITTY